MRNVRLLAFAACVALAACGRKPSPEQSPEGAASVSSAAAAASVGAPAEAAPAQPDTKPASIGPAPLGDTSATLESRRHAVLDVLFGGAAASHLRRDAVEPGATFNPALRDVVAPEVLVRPPKVRMGTTQVTGDMAPELVQRVVRQQFGRLRSCYVTELTRNPKAEGSVELRFQIDKKGSVKALSAKTIDLPTSLGDCVKAAVSQVGFPEPPGTVQVVYPILLAPG